MFDDDAERDVEINFAEADGDVMSEDCDVIIRLT